MSTLKNSIFWIALYLTCIVILAEFDYEGSAIIDFAKYFYFVAVLVIPATVFFPSIAKVNKVIPMAVWGGIYIIMLQTLDRKASSDGFFGTVVLEFVLVEAGAWLGYQLAFAISHAESVMDALALSAFPNTAHDVELENQRIKVEITRSRRYHRPLSLVVLQPEFPAQALTTEMLKSIQHDLTNRFNSARIGQIIDENIRQTDLVLKDRRGNFIILCPETELSNVDLLAKRVAQVVQERSTLQILWGTASFPEDALTFDDLLQTAQKRIVAPTLIATEQVIALKSG